MAVTGFDAGKRLDPHHFELIDGAAAQTAGAIDAWVREKVNEPQAASL